MEGMTAERKSEKSTPDAAKIKSSPSKKKTAKGTTASVKLKKENTTLKSEKAELTDRLLRTVAEFENYKKRVERDFSEMTIRANASLVTQLLPVLDDFERSLDPEHIKGVNKKFREGIELIVNNLHNTLHELGLEEIQAVGERFNPEFHEALLQVERDGSPPGIILEEHSKGYRFRDLIIRHSKVIVSK